jgi:GPI ethanolamine phosphate transferase 1
MLLPFAHRLYPNSYYIHRLMMIFVTFAPTFVILTISYEGLFYFVFCMTLATWVRLEHALYVYQKQPTPQTPSVDSEKHSAIAKTTVDGDTFEYRALTISDTRVALFFFFLVQSAFFSTGNIASVSSFSLESVNRLIPIFNPFSQGALLILKLMIPFAVMSANLGILNKRLEVAPSALFMTVMTISDISTLNFFYMVRDDGSWLEIGTTISHFFIANLLCLFVAGLEFVSEMFVSGVNLGDASSSSVTAAFKELSEDGISNGSAEKSGH